MLQNNSWLCSEIIIACTTIITKPFPAISGFQSTERAPYYREDTHSWSHQLGQFHPQNQTSVQIHHIGKSHWVTSLQSENDSTVYVLDSYSKQFTLTPSLEIQFSSIYG